MGVEGLPNVDRGFMKRDILVDKVRRGGGKRAHGLLKGIFCGCTAFTILVDELGREGEEGEGGGGDGRSFKAFHVEPSTGFITACSISVGRADR